MRDQWVWILLGFAVGAASSVPSWLLCGFLLKRRDKTFQMKKVEKILLAASFALIGGIVGWRAGGSLRAVYLLLVMMDAGCIFYIDAAHRIIPNELVLSVFLLAALFGFTGNIPFRIGSSLVGLAACFVIFFIPSLFGQNIGVGDVKLAAAMGFALGFTGSLYAVAAMGGLVLIYVLLGLGMPMAEKLKQKIPMGPFLSVALVAVSIL
ncbi:MAG: A24 family peptidase [Eubacteriales bacterium]|nr:A24 family peptidase [Eubacteriales bacterium]